MLLQVQAAVGLPVMALVLFTILEATVTGGQLWGVLSDAGQDLSILGIGIVGGVFLNLKIPESGAIIANTVLLGEVILAACSMYVNTRPLSLRLTKEYQRAYASIFIGLIGVAVPGGLIIRYGGH